MSSVTFWFGWFWRAIWTMPEFLGGNWIGTIFAFACVLLYEARKAFSLAAFGGAPTAAKKALVLGGFLVDHWKNTLRLWVCVLVAFLVGHTLDLVYRNENLLSTQNAGLSATVSANVSACDKENGNLRVSEATQRSRADTLSNQNRDQQNTINNCQTQAIKLLTPAEQKTTVISLGGGGGNSVTKETRFLLLTNKPISPLKMNVQCDQYLDTVGIAPAGAGGVFAIGPVRLSPNAWEVDSPSPAWTPTAPYIATVDHRGKEDAVCSFYLR